MRAALSLLMPVFLLPGPARAAGPQALPARDQAAIAQRLPALAALAPLEQVSALEELSALGPAGRNVAAAALKPELLSSGREELRARLGAEPAAALAKLAVGLHVEASGDELILERLDALARRLAPEGRVDRLRLGDWFDGAAASAAGARSGPALIWPLDGAAVHRRRVHLVGAGPAGYVLNGKPARSIVPTRVEDGLVKETVVLPNEPAAIVRLYDSGEDLNGFERRFEKLEALTPLAAAGIAPKLLEYGEASVPDKGRVYFLVQERVQGSTVRESPSPAEAVEMIKALFERVARQGLALIVPADEGWLLDHLLVGETESGGRGAYLADGAVEPAPAHEAAARHQMLLSLISDWAARPRETPPPAEEPPKLRQPGKLDALKATADVKNLVVEASRADLLKEALSRQGLPARGAAKKKATAKAALTLASEQAVLAAAEALLLDPAVVRVAVHPEVKGYLERRGVAPLLPILQLLPPSPERDAMILRIPPAAFARSESADVAAALSLLSGAPAAYAAIPATAWRRLTREDARQLARRRPPSGSQAAAMTIFEAWLRSHPEETSASLGPEFQGLGAPSAEVKAIFESGLTDEAQINAIEALLDKPRRLSVKDLVHLLERMPRGVEWGYKDGQGLSRFWNEVKQTGANGNWQDAFSPMDVMLAGRAISKTDGAATDAALLARVPALTKDIFDKSGHSKNKTVPYMTAVQDYLFRVTRALNERAAAAR